MIEPQPRRYRDARRSSAQARGYGSKWGAAAAGFKRKHPLCLGCAAIGVRSTTQVVDHTVPHRGDRAKFWDSANWQPACEWHHNAVKPILEARFERGEVNAAALLLDSPEAVKLTNAKRRRAVGTDGWLEG